LEPSLDRLVPLTEVMRLLGLGRTSVYSLVAAGKLSKPVHAVSRKSSWPESEIRGFIEGKKRERVAA
jgi:predicted DNA-binding transcriptional regulator AlpA